MNERITWKAAFTAAFLLFSGMIATDGYASVAISPVRVELSDSHDKDVIRITNQESSSRSYQVEVVEWSQTENRREVYSPTEDIIAVPPLFTLDTGEEQVIRVGMLTEADADTERSYRMFITELERPDEQGSDASGVAMRIQIGVPVFIAPTALPTANLIYVETTQVGDQTFGRFRNSGNTHVKVTEIHYSGQGSDEKLTKTAVVYILAGQTGLLPLPPAITEDNQVGTVTIVTENLGAMEYGYPFAL
jgi:fimbrial chaperone protein